MTSRTLDLSRALPRALPAVLAAFALSCASAQAATIPVTTTADTVADDGQCSLREALSAAASDSATAGCPAGSGADTVTLAAGTFTLTRAGVRENANATGDLDVTAGTVTLAGAGADATTIFAAGIDRVLDVLAGATVTVQDLRLSGGAAPAGVSGPDRAAPLPGQDVTGNAGTPGEDGGGVRNAGTLTVSDAAVTSNIAGRGGEGGRASGPVGETATHTYVGGAGAPGGSGGGIFSRGTLTVARSVFTGNAAGHGGGGGGSLAGVAVTGVTGVSSSNGGLGGAGGSGGGVYATGSTTLSGMTLSADSAGTGGSGGGGDGGNGSMAGDGHGGGAGAGGDGGAIAATATLAITDSGISDVHGGAGGVGGYGRGHPGFPGVSFCPTIVRGQNGGNGFGGFAGSGGAGAVAVRDGAATITRVLITASSAGDGGAAGFVSAGPGGESFCGLAPGADGTVFPGGPGLGGNGGAIDVSGAAATLAVQNVTLDGNASGASALPGFGGRGGAIAAKLATITARHVTLYGNRRGVNADASSAAAIDTQLGANLLLSGSIIAGHDGTACVGPVADDGGDLRTSAGCPGAPADPLLGPLQDNGGPTATRALAAGSPAVDAVAAVRCAPTDQRGFARPAGARCDAGAFQHDAAAPPASPAGPATAAALIAPPAPAAALPKPASKPLPTAASAVCIVPKLKGRSLSRARKLLHAAGCKVGRVKRPRSSADGPVVTRQSPAAGTRAKLGAKVAVTLGHHRKKH